MKRKAARAINKRIRELAPAASAEDLVKLAEAHSKLRFGAQGRTDYNYTQRIYREQPLEKETGFKSSR